jgi:cytochrome bd-type quinol oxidase subunit 1
VIGSVFASTYARRLTRALPAHLPGVLVDAAHQSAGAALAVAAYLAAAGHSVLAIAVHDAASNAFIHGLSVGCLVAGGVAAAGAVMAALLLPAQPSPWAAKESAIQPAAKPAEVLLP